MGTITGPEPKNWPSWGIDLSSHNSLTVQHWDWLGKHDCAFAVLRATNGKTPDEKFDHHVFAAETCGLKVGGYMTLRPDREVPVAEQVDTFLVQMEAVTHRPWCYAVDIEGAWDAADKPSSALFEAVTRILTRTGRRPLMYTYASFWKTWLSRHVGLRAFPLWGAWYPTTRPGERSFAEVEQRFGRSVQVWQYGGGELDGQPGSPKIDKNVTKR